MGVYKPPSPSFLRSRPSLQGWELSVWQGRPSHLGELGFSWRDGTEQCSGPCSLFPYPYPTQTRPVSSTALPVRPVLQLCVRLSAGRAEEEEGSLDAGQSGAEGSWGTWGWNQTEQQGILRSAAQDSHTALVCIKRNKRRASFILTRLGDRQHLLLPPVYPPFPLCQAGKQPAFLGGEGSTQPQFSGFSGELLPPPSPLLCEAQWSAPLSRSEFGSGKADPWSVLGPLWGRLPSPKPAAKLWSVTWDVSHVALRGCPVRPGTKADF